jgi:hypothetical protein
MNSKRRQVWFALLLPAVSWYVFQQGLGMTLRGDCKYAGFPLGTVWGVASLVVCAAAAGMALVGVRNRTGGDQFLARIAMLSAGLFALAIAYQTLATAIIPPCAR